MPPDSRGWKRWISDVPYRRAPARWGSVFVPYKRFGHRPTPWRRANSFRPSISIPEGWNRPLGGGTQNKRTSKGLSPIGTQCEPMGFKPYMGKERFCGTDTTKSLLIYQRTEPCLDKECLEVSPDSQHNSGIVNLVRKAFLLNQSTH